MRTVWPRLVQGVHLRHAMKIGEKMDVDKGNGRIPSPRYRCRKTEAGDLPPNR
jgi:hypothetical protein